MELPIWKTMVALVLLVLVFLEFGGKQKAVPSMINTVQWAQTKLQPVPDDWKERIHIHIRASSDLRDEDKTCGGKQCIFS